MKFPDSTNRTGINTIGLAGCIVLAGVVFTELSAWYLIASSFLILLGVGLESGKSND
jgi:hypothetical protein